MSTPMNGTPRVLGLALVFTVGVVGFASRSALAQSVEGAYQLGVGSSLLSYSNAAATAEALDVEVKGEEETVRWGMQRSATIELGYGASDAVVVGALVRVGGESTDSDVVTSIVQVDEESDEKSSAFELSLGPKVDMMFSPHLDVRPFIGAMMALTRATSAAKDEESDTSTSMTGFSVQGWAGFRAFVTQGFSLDPALFIGWSSASGDSDTDDVNVDVSASGFAVGVRAVLSGWMH